MDLDTFITTLYVLVDDWYKAEMAEKLVRRGGPPPKMSDSEVLTVALAGQWRKGTPWQSERGVVRYMQQHGRGWFPQMLSRSSFNARVRWLWGAFVLLQQRVASWLSTPSVLYEVVDCTPLPACSPAQDRQRGHWLWWSTWGRGGTQGRWFWGEQLLVSVTPQAAITGWLLIPGYADDRWALQALISQRAGQAHGIAPAPWRPWRRLSAPPFVGPLQACGQPHKAACYLADQGFNGIRWQRHWFQHYGVTVLAAPPANSRRAWNRTTRYWLKRKRQIIETTFARLSDVFDLKRLHAHSRWGQYTRLAIVMAAYNIGLWLNRQLGRKEGALATLIC